MNIYKFFFFWTLWACLFYSCTDPILDSAFEEYTPPAISITKNEQSGSEITIRWQAGNQFALEFSYILEPLEDKWSTWNADTTAYYNHLDENDYLFKVKSRYEEGSEQESPDSVLFTINNISGPGLRFFPLYMEVYTSSTFTMDIYAEEVVGLIGAEISCLYNPNQAVLDTASISAGSYLASISGQPVIIKEYNVETGSLLLTIATALDGGIGLTGSGSLVQLSFTAISEGIFDLSFANTSVYVHENAPETTVLYTSLTSATVVIE